MYEDVVKSLRICGTPQLVTEDCIAFHDGCCEAEPVCMYELMRKAADAIEELSHSKDMAFVEEDGRVVIKFIPKWIPVEERLPEEGTAVNITWVNHRPAIYYQHIKDKPQTATGVYYRGKWYWWSAVVQDYLAEYGKCEPDEMDAAIEVTHWMPLPDPPKGDE